MDTCETVKIVSPVTDQNPHGFVVINKSDVTAEHELFESGEAAAASGTSDSDKAERAAMFAFLRENGIEPARNAKTEALLAKVEEVNAAKAAALAAASGTSEI